MPDESESSAVGRFESYMAQWRTERNQPGYNPLNLLLRLCELFEEQINLYYSVDPDPLDDRHTVRATNGCEFGLLLRLISAHDSFFNRLLEYLSSSDDPRNPVVEAAARLLCCIQHGVTIKVIPSETDETLKTLYSLAFSDVEPSNCYAMLILSSILEDSEVVYVTKQKNIDLISRVIGLLNKYTKELDVLMASNPIQGDVDDFRLRLGSFHLAPLTIEMKIRLCLAYLTSLAEYRDIMPFMYDGNVLKYVYLFMQPKYSSRDIRLTFEVLRLLAGLMCHRCVHLDFVESEGLDLLMMIPRPSVAASVVGVVMYYVSYFQEAMERMCTVRKPMLSHMVDYALWLIERSHASARIHSLYFLHIALCYGTIFEIFVTRRGLVYLFNALCVLPIKLTDDVVQIERASSSWHVVRAALATILRYLDVALLAWIDSIDPALASVFDEPPARALTEGNRSLSFTTEQMNRLIFMAAFRIRGNTVFQPIEELNELGAIPVLFRVIARNAYVYFEWPGRHDSTRSAVDILNRMALSSRLAEAIVGADVYSFPNGIVDTNLSVMRSSRSPRHGGRGGTIRLVIESDSSSSASVSTDDEENITSDEGANDAQTAAAVFSGEGTPTTHSERYGVRQQGDSTGNRNTLRSEVPSSDDYVNGLLMLVTMLSGEEQEWDVLVRKSILCLINTLVYRPIDGKEHPDRPVLATSVLPSLSNTATASPDACSFSAAAAAGLNESALVCTPKTRGPPSTPLSRSGVTRRRRLEIGSTSTPPFIQPDSQTEFSESLFAMPRIPELASSPGTSGAATSSTRPGNGGRIAKATISVALLQQQMRLWCAVRRQHGLMLLLQLLEVRKPLGEADSIRTLACRGLVGLTRSEEVRIMLSKMPLFTKSKLQLLMKEPVLQDRVVEHAEFCRYGGLLLRLVLGSSASISSGDTCASAGSSAAGGGGSGAAGTADSPADRSRRALVLARTRIHWDPDELLEFVYQHLQSKGLHKTAATLQQEAGLRLTNGFPHQIPLCDSDSEPSTPVANVSGGGASMTGESVATPSLRITKSKPLSTPAPVSTSKVFRDRTPLLKSQDLASAVASPSPVGVLEADENSAEASGEMSLSRIVEAFLTHQHAQCPHPVTLVPRFSLRSTHRCPAPRPAPSTAVTSVSAFLAARESHGYRAPTARFLRRLLYSRFKPLFTVRDFETDYYTTATFGRGSGYIDGDEGLFLGTAQGAVAWVNLEDARISSAVPLELLAPPPMGPVGGPVSRLEHTRDGRRLLVVAQYGNPTLLVTRLHLRDANTEAGNTASASAPLYVNADRLVFSTDEANYAEFNRTGLQHLVVATYGKVAKVFDINTGQRMTDLFSSVKQSDYVNNKATFSMDDHLVLNDGVVWDLRCSAAGVVSHPVHKIDKFQDIVSGVFHPNGQEIVVGSAVWDMRTWRLLHTVQAMDKLEVVFSPNSEIIYAGNFGIEPDDPVEDMEGGGNNGGSKGRAATMLRTVDALDYSLIAHVQMRRPVEALSVDCRGLRLALIERAQPLPPSASVTVEPVSQCRIYAVGQYTVPGDLENTDEDEDDEGGRHDDEEDDEVITGSSGSVFGNESDGLSEIDDDDPDSLSVSDSDEESGSESSWETEEEIEVSSLHLNQGEGDGNEDTLGEA